MDSLRSQYLPSSPQDGAYHMDNQSVPPVPYARAELETIIRKYAVRFLKVDLTTEDMSPENVRLTSAELGFLLLQIERALRSEITRGVPSHAEHGHRHHNTLAGAGQPHIVNAAYPGRQLFLTFHLQAPSAKLGNMNPGCARDNEA
ncbi:hypothetical protein WJX84_007880 [Apatococcus fuscideae]|uniref:Uncharacterized protein n=1 Tax=Apatococcus fuscideae TaxID=2026836 RepID=A0AAW1SQW1_9CHLO